MNELLEKLKTIRSDVDFENCTSLVDDNVIKSFDIIQIVGAIQELYGIKVPVSELKPHNFNSLEAMEAMIERLEDE